MSNEFLDLYGAKVVEYLLAILYLLLFVGYWRWVQGEGVPRHKRPGPGSPRGHLTRSAMRR